MTPPIVTNLLLFGFQMTWTTDYTPAIHQQQSAEEQSSERRHHLALSWAVRSCHDQLRSTSGREAACACDFC